MTSRETASGKEARGRVRFEMQANEQALAVHLDRQGFRRLLQTLEQLAQTGGQQIFERSGRQRRGRNGKAPKTPPLTKLVFEIDEKPER